MSEEFFKIIRKQMAERKKAETKMDDAELCASYDGECEICPKQGKCRFRRN